MGYSYLGADVTSLELRQFKRSHGSTFNSQNPDQVARMTIPSLFIDHRNTYKLHQPPMTIVLFRSTSTFVFKSA
jgi:hypothetical protein